MTIHLHHIHLNSSDRERSERFYEKHVAAKRIRLNDAADALHVAPVLFLVDEKVTPPRSSLPTALQHVGFGSSDPEAWYMSAYEDGVSPDTRGNTLFSTNETPTVGASGSGPATFGLLGVEPPACCPVPDKFSYMYVLGPDQERIEIWSGIDERVNHVHFTTANLAGTMRWYQEFLGLPMTSDSLALFGAFFLDDILFFYEPIGTASDYKATDDHVLGHIAFSVTDLDAWLERARDKSIEVVAEPASVNGFESFFVRGPDGLLIELVKAVPSQEFCPSSRTSNNN